MTHVPPLNVWECEQHVLGVNASLFENANLVTFKDRRGGRDMVGAVGIIRTILFPSLMEHPTIGPGQSRDSILSPRAIAFSAYSIYLRTIVCEETETLHKNYLVLQREAAWSFP